MAVQVGKLHKNKIVKDLSGNIIDWFDEVNGGWIVQKRVIVNHERWNEEVRKQKDRAEAAKAATMAKIRDDYPELKEGEEQQSGKTEKLEKEVAELKEMLKKALEK